MTFITYDKDTLYLVTKASAVRPDHDAHRTDSESAMEDFGNPLNKSSLK